MNAVGKLGSYISRSVYTVSGPFHPFGGAVDIIVVEQQDGSFKSSPWYVRFGKFQGVLKAKEKVVSINVNGAEAGFHMYLDHKGEAHLLREVDVEEGHALLSPSSSGEDTDGQSCKRMPIKSKSCNYDAYESDSVTQIGLSNRNVLSRTNSRRSRILGLVFGKKAVKQGTLTEQENDAGVGRTDSLERAEIAADLLEVKWSTNLVSSRRKKDIGSRLCFQDTSERNTSKDLQITDKPKNVDSLINDAPVDNLTNRVTMEKNGSTDYDKDHNSHASSVRSWRSVEETGIEMSCLLPEYSIGTSTIGDDGKRNLEKPNKTGSSLVHDIDRIVNSTDFVAKAPSGELEIQDPVKLEICPVDKCPKDPSLIEKHEGSPESSFSVDENEVKSIPSCLSCETYTSSRFELDAELANGTSCLSSGTCEQSSVATLQTIDLVCQVNSEPIVQNEKEPSGIEEVLEKRDFRIVSHNEKSHECPGISSDSMEKDVITETYSQMVALQPLHGSVEYEPQSIFTVSTFSNSTGELSVDKNIDSKNGTSEFVSPLEPVCDTQISKIDPVQPNFFLTEISEEERLLFGDLDDLKGIDPRDTEEPIIHTRSSSTDRSGSEDLHDDAGDLRRKLKTVSSEVNIPITIGSQSEEVPRITKSLPNMWSHDSSLPVHDIDQSRGQTLDSDSNPLKQTLLKKDVWGSINAEADNDHQLSKSPEVTEDAKSTGQLKNGANHGDSSRSTDASNGSWRSWSFPFKRSGSIKVSQSALNYNRRSDTENIGNRKDATRDEKGMLKMKVTKKKIKATTPTSEQLASLNLKEGRNTVVFTFSTPMLGKQQVDARIYLWKWDTHIVISDVDGTITRSDLLGQVMPLVGVDWSQTGVAHLFSAIKENGYQLLFLTARAISQAYHTRRFLFNLKQDGKALPEGPVVLSPDGLFPSLYREVVRRAPHEFKISCLEDIKALFPSDRNPFYAGFGNRDTDEFSYLKVGIPKGKIFIINPKGEIVVNRRVDTKSYTSFHALVNDMFPLRTSSELEDFNSWNFWRLPPSDIDI